MKDRTMSFHMKIPKEWKKLNLGCGRDLKPKREGWVNADGQKAEGVDKSFDFEKFPWPFKANTFDYIFGDNVLEHLDNISKVMDELWRICKNDAIIEIFVPYWNNSAAYNAPDHKHYFNTRTIENLCDYKSSSKINPENKFELINVRRIPGNAKKKIPLSILNFLDKFLHSIFINIHAKIRVKK